MCERQRGSERVSVAEREGEWVSERARAIVSKKVLRKLRIDQRHETDAPTLTNANEQDADER